MEYTKNIHSYFFNLYIL